MACDWGAALAARARSTPKPRRNRAPQPRARAPPRAECIPGFGSSLPDAVCELCPDGMISRGGFKAQCVECGDLAWPNEFSNECSERRRLWLCVCWGGGWP